MRRPGHDPRASDRRARSDRVEALMSALGQKRHLRGRPVTSDPPHKRTISQLSRTSHLVALVVAADPQTDEAQTALTPPVSDGTERQNSLQLIFSAALTTFWVLGSALSLTGAR
jgi:hypothetical protein